MLLVGAFSRSFAGFTQWHTLAGTLIKHYCFVHGTRTEFGTRPCVTLPLGMHPSVKQLRGVARDRDREREQGEF